LKLIGDGPLAATVAKAAAENASIQWLGSMPLDAVYELIGRAAILVLPSQCYETFARVIIEAFAKGTPVVVSKLGAMAEIVDDGHTGLFFKPGDPADLAAKVQSIIANPLKLKCMRQAARRIFDQNFTADANHKILMTIYDGAMRSGSRLELQN
jgi:glycosyltransferase involved in cell wall biosynthesis